MRSFANKLLGKVTSENLFFKDAYFGDILRDAKLTHQEFSMDGTEDTYSYSCQILSHWIHPQKSFSFSSLATSYDRLYSEIINSLHIQAADIAKKNGIRLELEPDKDLQRLIHIAIEEIRRCIYGIGVYGEILPVTDSEESEYSKDFISINFGGHLFKVKSDDETVFVFRTGARVWHCHYTDDDGEEWEKVKTLYLITNDDYPD